MNDELPGTVRVLNGQQSSWPEATIVPGGLHNATIAFAAAEELHLEQVLRLAGCNRGSGTTGRRPRDWSPRTLVGDDGCLDVVLRSDARLAAEACQAILEEREGADDLVEQLLVTLEEPFVDPFAIRGSKDSPAARDLSMWVARSCWQAAELLGSTAQFDLGHDRGDRAEKLLAAGDVVLSAPILVRHATGRTEHHADVGVRQCSIVDDAAMHIGVETARVDGEGRTRPTNTPERAVYSLFYTTVLMRCMSSGLRGTEPEATETPEPFAIRERAAATFGAALRHLRDPDRSGPDQEAATRLADALERTPRELDDVVTMLLRHSPVETRHLEHEVLRGFGRHLLPPGRRQTRRPGGQQRRVA